MKTGFLTALCCATLFAGTALADFEATSPDGRTIVLKDNFTWHYKHATTQDGGYVLDNWNRGHCSMTSQARFDLSSETFVAKLVTWYNWDDGQHAAAAGLYDPQGRVIVQRNIRRGGCDEYQPNWCEGIMEVRQTLSAGSYMLEVSPGRICNNAASNWEGFIRVASVDSVASQPPAQPPQQPTPTPTPATYQALGCFKDQQNRDLSGDFMSSDRMTTQACISACADKGFAFAGTQYSEQCFCGDTYGRYGPATNCDMACSGNASEICGGTWANSIYRIGRGQN